MPSKAVQVAEAVKDLLNAAPQGTFSMSFTAIRSYAEQRDLSALRDLTVTVVPKTRTEEPVSRGVVTEDVEVDVAIQKALAKSADPIAELAEKDALMELAEQVQAFFRFQRLDSPAAGWIGTEPNPLWSPEHMREKRLFTSVFTVTVRLME